MTIKPGDLCKTNLSQPGGLVAVLDIKPYSTHVSKLMAYIEHVQDHPYGYKKGERGWYGLDDLILIVPGYYITNEDDEA